MRTLVSFCVAVVITLAITAWVVSNHKNAQFNKQLQLLKSSWDAERAELEAALKAAHRPIPNATVSAASADPVAAKASARNILERLKKLRVAGADQRVASIRQIVHQLESLVDLGPDAVPAIREFLGKFEDVDYSMDPRGEQHGTFPERPAPGGNAVVQNLPRLDALLPPSLRLGLVQVLREMGGEQAEQVLAEMLSTSGRGVEVAYVARVLQEMVPNKYRDVAVAAAKDLLANPPSIDHPNPLDDNAKNYLYGVLSMYNDPSFASTAQGLIVTADGRVDQTALNYLTSALKDGSVPALYQAFKDSRVTNIWERASLANQIFSYAGSSAQANEILKEVVTNDSLPAWLRATAIQTVGGGQGALFGGAAPSDPAQIKARIDLLNSLPDLSDDGLARAKTDALQRLLVTLDADSGDDGAGRSFRSRLGDAPLAPGPASVPATK